MRYKMAIKLLIFIILWLSVFIKRQLIIQYTRFYEFSSVLKIKDRYRIRIVLIVSIETINIEFLLFSNDIMYGKIKWK